MKTIFKVIVLIFAFGLFSCSKDNDNGCNCKGKFTTIDHFGDGTYFYVEDTPIDCETREYTGSDHIQDNAIFVECAN